MICIPCRQKRQQLYEAAKRGDVRATAQTIREGITMSMDKQRRLMREINEDRSAWRSIARPAAAWQR